MKKGFLSILFSVCFLFVSFAQTPKEITVLYLLPLHLEESNIDISKIESDFDIYEIPSFEMIGFWEGAQLALKTYEDSKNKVNVIVRDISTDEQKLIEILNNSKLMNDVDLIIGPFYGSLFPIAAKYAAEHKITIVNPFSSRTDFVRENPYVYKLIPPLSARPESIKKQILNFYPNHQVVLWYGNGDTLELKAYELYFQENDIPFTLAKLGQGSFITNLNLLTDTQNVVIALFNNQTQVINQMRLLSGVQNSYPITLIFPEEWLNISSLDDDFYSIKNLYYFTNCFVDLNLQTINDFRVHYVETYQSPCQLDRYSYQGYDITKYFIDLFFTGNIEKSVTYTPMAYKLKFKQWTKGGYENDRVRLIQIQDFQRKEVNE
jgi:hypothetical protein